MEEKNRYRRFRTQDLQDHGNQEAPTAVRLFITCGEKWREMRLENKLQPDCQGPSIRLRSMCSPRKYIIRKATW